MGLNIILYSCYVNKFQKYKEDKGNVGSSLLCQKLFQFDGLDCQQWNKTSANRNLSLKQQYSKIIYLQVEVASFM